MSLYPVDPQRIVDFYNSQPFNLAHYINPQSKKHRLLITLEQLLNKNGMYRDVIIDEYRWKQMNDDEAQQRLFENLKHITQKNNKGNRNRLNKMTESEKIEKREGDRARYYETGKRNLEIRKAEDPETFQQKQRGNWNNWYNDLTDEKLEKRQKENRERMRRKRQKN